MRMTTKLHAMYGLGRKGAKGPVKIGIRAEDPARIWERRAPLTPAAVYELVAESRAAVEVVASPKRIFADAEYRKAGATIVPALTDPEIILGIKEPPFLTSSSSSSTTVSPTTFNVGLSSLSSSTPSSAAPTQAHTRGHGHETHLMFSHTIKGQEYNMPLLARYVAPSASASSLGTGGYPRLIDYELITGEDGKRTVGFGWFAGVAGVLESLSAMAQAHLEMGIASPFLYTPRPHTLPSLDRLRSALREIGNTIAEHGTPPQLGPFVIGLTGTGQVAQGCLSMLAELPIESVRVEDLPGLMLRGRSSEVDLRKIYLVHAKPEDYLFTLDGGRYEREHYYRSPQSYRSVFYDKVAPYLTLFLNGTGWSPSFPRLMDNKQLGAALAKAQEVGGARFTNIGDISCDVQGGLEFLEKATTLSAPTSTVTVPALPAVRMMAVDILPASIPYDASVHFSQALMGAGRLKELIAFHAGEVEELPETLRRATVAVHGKLTEGHGWLMSGVDRVYAGTGVPEKEGNDKAEKSRDPVRASGRVTPSSSSLLKTKKRILILGSGMVAAPAVDLIAQSSEFDLVVAGDSAIELERLVAPHHHVNHRIIDAADRRTYAKLVVDADVVISLLPVAFHVPVAEACLAGNTHLVTASYMSEEMSKLHDRATQKGLLFLTETGLDPGIDHCSAMELLDRFKRQGKHVLSFTSFCGGLPLPENAHVPLGYKFSWRPQGVLTAALNEAMYLLGGKVHKIPGDRLLKSYWPDIPITDEFKLEGLPNRDSLSYKKHYKIFSQDLENKARTIVRGTLRYPGFSSLMSSFAALGLLDTTSKVRITAWHELVPQCLQLKRDALGRDTSLATLIPPENVDALRDALEWLGLAKSGVSFNSAAGEGSMPPVPQGPTTPLDMFAFLLAHKLRYAPGERDMVVLSHEIITRAPSSRAQGQGQLEVHTSTLIQKGVLDYDVGARGLRPASAMARTVGLPAALAGMLVAGGSSGGIREAGVLRPTLRSIYAPIMERLRGVGIEMEEHSRVVPLSGAGSAVPRGTRRTRTGTVEEALGVQSSPEEPIHERESSVKGAGAGALSFSQQLETMMAPTREEGGREREVADKRDMDADRTWNALRGEADVPREKQF